MTWKYSEGFYVGHVKQFPTFTGEKVYMAPIRVGSALPAGLERWYPIVSAMLDGQPHGAQAYLMIDQADLKKGQYHRRPGVHVDGLWINEQWDTGTGQWKLATGRHGWRRAKHDEHQDLLLVSDVPACVIYEGEYIQRPVFNGGDMSYVDTNNMDYFKPAKGSIYRGDASTMLHESVPVDRDCKRTVVRINVVH